ncbi:MAG: hypothetical protein DRP82_00770 [Planctomycetota bacterium]|nr:MAG: hypothetical protein DRP82_00770 [Planctomycetota bacterium]
MKTLTIQVVNAGHNPLILWRDGATRLVNPKGIAVGALSTAYSAATALL